MSKKSEITGLSGLKKINTEIGFISVDDNTYGLQKTSYIYCRMERF